MAEDIEGEVQESTGDTAPSSEPTSDPAEELTSEIRRSIDTQRERGPDGKFVKSEGASRGSTAPAKGVATGAGAPDRPVPSAKDPAAAPAPAPGSPNPPPGFSVPTKQAWDGLPEFVKADIAKREQDIEAGLSRFGGMAKYAEAAERNGTTIQNAMNDYVAVETEIRRDPVRGLEFMCQRIGWNPVQVLKAWLSKYVPGQGGQQQQAPAQNYQPVDPSAIAAHAANMVRSEFARGQIDNDIAQFQANPANRFFPNVRHDMAILVQSGKASNLQEAYEAACWLHPEIRAILLQDMRGGGNAAARTAQRAQNAAKAVTGAPSNSHAGEPPKRRDLSLDEEIRANVAAQKGLS